MHKQWFVNLPFGSRYVTTFETYRCIFTNLTNYRHRTINLMITFNRYLYIFFINLSIKSLYMCDYLVHYLLNAIFASHDFVNVPIHLSGIGDVSRDCLKWMSYCEIYKTTETQTDYMNISIHLIHI